MQQKIEKTLALLEKTRHEYWNISRETGQFLNLLIRDRKYKTALEIGTSNGYSGIWITEALTQTEGHLYTVESNYKHRFPEATKNFQKAGLTKFITQILGHAPEIIPKIPRKFDLIFFDATKCEHTLYFEALKNRLKKGGIIITDNINSHRKELAKYIKMVQKNPQFFSVNMSIGSGLLISLKIK